MRILHYIPSLDLSRGGPVTAVFGLSDALASRGYDVTIATCEMGSPPPGWGRFDKKPTLVDLGGGPVNVRFLSSDQKAALAPLTTSHDVTHVHGVWDLSNLQAAKLARSAGRPHVVSVRGMLDDWSMSRHALKKRIVLATLVKSHLLRAKVVHLTAQAEFDQARKWFRGGTGMVIPNLLDLNPFRDPPGPNEARAMFPQLKDPGVRNVLFLSRVHHKKSPDVLIRAAALLRDRGVTVNVIFAGKGDDDYVRSLGSLAKELGLDNRVSFVGHVGGTLKTSLYQACDVLALPTHQENFGFVFPESLAAGTPVITTKGVDIWPELQSSGAAKIVDGTPAAFAQAIDDLTKDRAALQAMRPMAHEFAMRTYAENVVLDRFEAMYRYAVGVGDAPSGLARA